MIKIKNIFYLKIVFIYFFLIINYSCSSNIKNINDIFIENEKYTSKINFISNEKINYNYFILYDPYRLIVDFKKTNINLDIKNVNKKIKLNSNTIKLIRLGYFKKNITRLVIELKNYSFFDIFYLKKNLFSLSIVIYKDKYISNDYIKKNISKLINNINEKNKKKENKKKLSKNKSIITIMLDPGHGGEDPGAIGQKNTYEKNVVLQIAKRIYNLIQKKPYMRVYMTRNKDVFVSLKDRIIKARRKKIDIFISIHTDSAKKKFVKGASVFSISRKEANIVAEKYYSNNYHFIENIIGIKKSNDEYIDHTIFDLIQNFSINESVKFGKQILNSLEKITDLHKKNIGQAGFAVLKAPEIPSILIEIAFISNLQEEKNLNNSIYQQKVAKAIFEGIEKYYLLNKKKYNH
ncbi:b2817 [Wigglesworthia glossinidia endosymbiont of Glossina brevipalpis]|uniref:N-acetylmuramoyl-L-alanine amidase n=1 Tax=Wigglesworthia glossinidia brevipalpis TaxID=36870 RepID=Q8D2T6_WIGBR|nr:b2817 [Wigglesworthia glossinidia endosymbiont of Glossina brevipalpis]